MSTVVKREGLGNPPEVQNATNEYRGEMDVLARFIADCCVEQPAAKVTSAALYEAYTTWCEEVGERSLSQRMFGVRLQERNYNPVKSGSTRFWRGIGLAASPSVGTLGTQRDAEHDKKGVVLPFKGKTSTMPSQSVPVSHPTPPDPEEEMVVGFI